MEKESFKYSYIKPVSDWFEEINVEIKPEDYLYFRVELRYGPSWWLIEIKPEDKPKFTWVHKEIGSMFDWDLKRFMEWASDGKGSRIIEIKTSGNDFDIIKEISKLQNDRIA